MLAQLRARLEDEAEPFGVWPEHWHAVQTFRAMGTQWRAVAGFSRVLWLGLDYSALRLVERTVRQTIEPELVQPWPVVFAQLRELEAVAIEARQRER